MDLPIFDGRDAIIFAVVLVAVYLLVSLLRLGMIKLRRGGAGRSRKPVPKVEASEGEDRPKQATSRSNVEETSQQDSDAALQYVDPRLRQTHSPFNEQLFRSGVETELQELRGEVAALKEALTQLKTTRAVSPQYNEAMLLAQRGMSAQGIADHCTISIGEAELVVALNRNKQEHESYDRPYDGR